MKYRKKVLLGYVLVILVIVGALLSPNLIASLQDLTLKSTLFVVGMIVTTIVIMAVLIRVSKLSHKR